MSKPTTLQNAVAVTVSNRLAFLIEYLDLAEATGDPNARWEPYQVQFLNNSTLLDYSRKARQVGWSWTAAADAIASAILEPRVPSIFVSINQDEAKEKIRYAKQIIEALDADVRPKLLHDAETFIELANGSRLISHPCRPVRGKARARIYLDEFAHYPKDREIYLAALPTTTHGGVMRIGSSPLGASGMFWEIGEQKLRAYPGYTRRWIPWWAVQSLCQDVDGARQIAPAMLTEERVQTFGSKRLKEIFENMPLEDFQQEYECAWIDEATAWITWDEIKRNQVDAQAGQLAYWQANTVDSALAVIDEMAEQAQNGKLETALAGGMDIGRKHDLTEITFVGKTTTTALPYRLGITLRGAEFDDQKAVVAKVLRTLPVTQLLIDQNGIGMQLAENLHAEFGDRAQGVDFTNPNKELWSVELKVRMQRGNVPIPLDRELAYHIHSIRKKVTASKNAVFDAERSEHGHADKYWALALAVWAAQTPKHVSMGDVAGNDKQDNRWNVERFPKSKRDDDEDEGGTSRWDVKG